MFTKSMLSSKLLIYKNGRGSQYIQYTQYKSGKSQKIHKNIL